MNDQRAILDNGHEQSEANTFIQTIELSIICKQNPCTIRSLLIIQSVSSRHAGKYTCIASNRAGNTSESSSLAVKGTIKPLFIREAGIHISTLLLSHPKVRFHQISNIHHLIMLLLKQNCLFQIFR